MELTSGRSPVQSEDLEHILMSVRYYNELVFNINLILHP